MKVYKSFCVAGFKYYGGFKVRDKLKPGVKLKLKPKPKNRYDENAVEIYYKKCKLGYIPRNQNYSIAQILNSGYKIFKCYVQKVDDEQNIQVAVAIKKYAS